MLHVFNVCLRDNHCPSQTGHRAHATLTQTGPSLLQPEAADSDGLALETGNSSGQQRAGVKARARAPPSREGEDARCSKHTGWQASMHAKHDGKDATQGKTVKESEKARKNPSQAGHGLVGAARTATWAHSSRGRLALGLGLRLAAVGVVSS
jgi:hypothetical protein